VTHQFSCCNGRACAVERDGRIVPEVTGSAPRCAELQAEKKRRKNWNLNCDSSRPGAPSSSLTVGQLATTDGSSPWIPRSTCAHKQSTRTVSVTTHESKNTAGTPITIQKGFGMPDVVVGLDDEGVVGPEVEGCAEQADEDEEHEEGADREGHHRGRRVHAMPPPPLESPGDDIAPSSHCSRTHLRFPGQNSLDLLLVLGCNKLCCSFLYLPRHHGGLIKEPEERRGTAGRCRHGESERVPCRALRLPRPILLIIILRFLVDRWER
jgi:hypothetical protein